MSEFYRVWSIILIFLFLVLCWLFLTPLELQVDTRIPQVRLRWITIGEAIVKYDNDKWRLTLNILFFHKNWDLGKIIFKERKKKKHPKPRKKRVTQKGKRLKKFLNLLKSFRVTKWELAIDTGDVTKNAWLYPLNFFGRLQNHLCVNFTEENYLMMVIRNAPWKMAYAFLKK